jgi:predicted aspartyl protease
MKGIVDESGRAILPVEILCTKHPSGVQVNVWIDTGFTGDLVLPDSLIEDLELSPVLLTGPTPGTEHFTDQRQGQSIS